MSLACVYTFTNLQVLQKRKHSLLALNRLTSREAVLWQLLVKWQSLGFSDETGMYYFATWYGCGIPKPLGHVRYVC